MTIQTHVNTDIEKNMNFKDLLLGLCENLKPWTICPSRYGNGSTVVSTL